jgi:molybdate transport system substrate-binding protein
MSFARRLSAVLALGLALGAQAAELTVSAASSLTNAFHELGPVFEAAHPGHKLRFNHAASGDLLQQIANGAPVDVFASADQETMNLAQTRGLVRGPLRRNFASNTLVAIVPAAGKLSPRTLAELAHPAYQRIAIGLPASVPVGRYTASVLEAAGQWGAIEARVIGAHNVRQVLDYVARAEVDAGFVYATDAALMPGKVKVAFAVPTKTPILYPAAPVATSANAALAQRFVEFLVSPPARAVLARHGFGQP